MKISFTTLSELAETVYGSPRGTYSGRGMYGKSCAGIVINPSDLLALGASIGALEDEELRAWLTSRYSTDTMGYSTIVYWPGIVCTDSPEDSEEW